MSLMWRNDAVSEELTQSFDLRDRGLLLGDGLFETLLVVRQVPLWVGPHFDRLEASAKILGIPVDRQKLEFALADLMTKSGPEPQVLRVTLTRGPTDRGYTSNSETPGLMLTLDPFDITRVGEPVTLATSAFRRSASAFGSGHKTLSYVDNVMASREASAKGAGDALLLNTDGNVASTTMANVFFLQGGKLVTPALPDGILPGIARAQMLKIAGELELEAEERSVAPVELFAADAVFTTNSLRFVRSVTKLDGKAMGERSTAMILDALLEAAGVSEVI